MAPTLACQDDKAQAHATKQQFKLKCAVTIIVFPDTEYDPQPE